MIDPAIAALITRVADLEDEMAEIRLRLAELERDSNPQPVGDAYREASDLASLAGQGLTQEEIAQRLGVSSRTVRRRLRIPSHT
jgi:DNA-binding NarL/FixJ family response regulator